MMVRRHVMYIILLIGHLLIVELTVAEIQSCTTYSKLLPSGTCMKYLQYKQIAQSQEIAVKRNNKLVRFYDTYIPLYASYLQNGEKTVRRLLNLYGEKVCGHDTKMKRLLDSVKIPSAVQVQKCAGDIKQFLCQATHPICLTISSGQRVTALPCRDKCEGALSTPSCLFLPPLYKTFQKANQLCPALSTIFRADFTKNCSYFPQATLLGEQYCPIKEVIHLGHRMNDMYSADEYVRKNTMPENLSCTTYNQLLPTGTCLKYLQYKEIAQSQRIAVKRNDKLVKFYDVYIPLYGSYHQSGERALRRLLNFYAVRVCGGDIRIKTLLDSVKIPSGDDVRKCANDIKQFICQTQHPICLKVKFDNQVAALPCRNKCEEALSTPSCHFFNPLYAKLQQANQLCPALSTLFKADFSKNCSYFPKPTLLGEDYCPVKDASNMKYDMNEIEFTDEYSGNSTNKVSGLNIVSKRRKEKNMSKSQKEQEEDINRCVHYKSVAPSGVCLQYFANSHVAQSAEYLTTVDNNIGRIYTMFDAALLKPRDLAYSSISNDLWQWGFDTISSTCSNLKEFNALKRSLIQLSITTDIRECLHENGWFYCHVYHPKCVSSNRETFKTSPVCRETCNSIWNSPKCSSVKEIYKLYREMRTHCDVPYNEYIEWLLNCEKYPALDMKHIERCQLRNITDSPSSSSCYHSNGFSYNGTVSTAGGQKCAMWNTDPYLNQKMYPSLIRNFCRNPQGIAARPWCYTNMTTKTWAYCDVVKCNTVSENWDEFSQVTGNNYLMSNAPLDEFVEDSSWSFSYQKKSVRVSHEPLTVTLGILSVVVVFGIVSAFYVYKNRNSDAAKIYRQLDDIPDINYVRVIHDGDIN